MFTIKEKSEWHKLLYLAILFIAGLFLSSYILEFISKIFNISESNNINFVYTASIVQSIFVFLLPTLITLRITSTKTITNNLSLSRSSKGVFRIIVFVILLYILSLSLISLLSLINKNILFTDVFKPIAGYITKTQNSGDDFLNLMLNSKSIINLFLNILIIGFIAAFSEEVLFRGFIQKTLQSISKNHHIAIWITAIFFSSIHFQFVDFLPRLILGAILGYIYFYTKTLWAPILFHFINNSLSVVIMFFGNYAIPKETTSAHIGLNTAMLGIVSSILIILVFYIYKKKYVND